jgi:hypothetical protein
MTIHDALQAEVHQEEAQAARDLMKAQIQAAVGRGDVGGAAGG